MVSRPAGAASSRVLPYAAGIAAIVLITAVRVALIPYIGDSVALLPFVLSVVIAAMLGGFVPAMTMVVLSIISADLFLMKPVWSFAIGDPDEVMRLLMFIVVGFGIAALGQRRKKAEAALLHSESRLRKFAESSLVGMMTSHVSGGISEANDAFLRLVGYTREELDRGMIRWPDLTPPEHFAADAQGLVEANETGACTPYEKEYLHKDGHRVPVLIGYSRVGDDDFMVFVLDLTDRKHFENQLRTAKEEAETANAAKDEFLMVVSHELRTPMTSLLGWVQMLLLGQVDPKDVGSAVQRIHESALVEVEIIENILDLARLGVGRFVTRRDLVDVAILAEASVAQFQPKAAERAIDLVGAIHPRQLVLGDGDRLRQVINNLISNALKFSEPGGRVQLNVSDGNNRVVIEVTDEGVGIKPDFLPHVFDRFRQADAAHSRRYGGLGLGLAIAKHLVEAHGGVIHAHSAGHGHGAKFRVELPAATPR